MIKLSIIVPLYNYQKYIGDCLRSCVSQQTKEVEIIVVDDNSTDGSFDAVQRKIDMGAKIKLFGLNQNMGYSHAKNVGIIKAGGAYIVHLDADDMLSPNSLAVRYRELEKDKSLDMVCANVYKFQGSKSLAWCLANKKKLEITDKSCHAQTIMIRKSVYEKYGLYYEKLRSKSDKEMWYRLGVHDKAPFGAAIRCKKINVPVAFYRRHKKAMAVKRTKNVKYDLKIEKQFNDRMKQLKKQGITTKNTRFM